MGVGEKDRKPGRKQKEEWRATGRETDRAERKACEEMQMVDRAIE